MTTMAGPDDMLDKGAAATTDPAFGKAPQDRTLEEHLRLGAINLDKSAGPTSHQVVAWVKKALHIERAGHGGTLDPNVTGVLPVALLDGTRVIRTLLEAPKEYVGVFESHRPVDQAQLRAVFGEFIGPIYQVPPLKSAVKRQLRVRTIYGLDVLETSERQALFRVSCEAGTYIRKLCTDVGTIVGSGGHMRGLRRTRTGPFSEADAVGMHDVRDAYENFQETGDDSWLREVVQPVEALVAHLPRVVARDSAVDALCHGAHLAAPGIAQIDPRLREGAVTAVFSLKGELISVGKARMDADAAMAAEHGLVVETDRVIMTPGTYPRAWKTGDATRRAARNDAKAAAAADPEAEAIGDADTAARIEADAMADKAPVAEPAPNAGGTARDVADTRKAGDDKPDNKPDDKTAAKKQPRGAWR